MRFRHKAFAALLAFVAGALGAHRFYLGQRLGWLPLAVTLAMINVVGGFMVTDRMLEMFRQPPRGGGPRPPA